MESKINLKIKKVNIKMEEAFPELKKEIDLYLLLSRNDENDFDSLVSKKDEFREKLFKTFEYCIYSERLEILEIKCVPGPVMSSRLIIPHSFLIFFGRPSLL